MGSAGWWELHEVRLRMGLGACVIVMVFSTYNWHELGHATLIRECYYDCLCDTHMVSDQHRPPLTAAWLGIASSSGGASPAISVVYPEHPSEAET